jgi:hypothetical protein
MKQSYLKFPQNEWGVVVVTDFDVDYDHDVMVEQMRSFGLSIRNAEKALRILANYNTGMAISNETLKMSVIYVSDTTNESQFWDTCAHELAHVCAAIIDAYDVNYRSEDAAYLSGFLMRQLVEEIGEPCL